MNAFGLSTAMVLLVASASVGAATAASPQPAVWDSHTLIVDLGKLPRRYTCDDLWYKFKAVLTTLGARPDIQILPYGCERTLGAAGSSPKVQLQFSVPRVVSGKDIQWADLKVLPQSIRLQPGSPARIDARDCDLLNEIRSTLLPYLGATVTDFNLACQAQVPQFRAHEPQSVQSPPFGLTVKALIPVSESLSGVASAVPADRLGRSGS